MVNSSVYDIIIISESWLCSSISNEELGLNNYSIFRADRNVDYTGKHRGGGVLIAIRNDFCAHTVLCSISVESIFVHLKYNDLDLIVGGVYIPPASPLSIFEDYCSDLELIFERFPDSSYVIAGDFNLPHLVWNGNDILFDSSTSKHEYYDVINSTSAFLNLKQVNLFPNGRNVFLDLIFTNIVALAVLPAVDPIFPQSLHHSPYSWYISCTSSSSLHSEVQIFDFNNGDYISLNEFYASINWDNYFLGLNLDEKVAVFYDIVFNGFEQFIPHKILRHNARNNYPVWFDKELKDLCRNKRIAHSIYKKSSRFEDYIYFKSLRSRCKQLCEQLYAAYISNVNVSIFNNPKFFWKFVRDKKKSDSSIPAEMTLDQHSVKGGDEVANLFAQYFSSVYAVDDLRNFACCFDSSSQVNDSGLYISLSDVFNHISLLKSSCNPGPDGVPSIVLKNCKFSLCLPLFILFQTSLSEGVFPQLWKNSYVIPIFKSGQRNNVDNYRGVCNQSAIPKLLDAIVSIQLRWASASIISSSQHGFFSNRSTLSNLLEYKSFLNEAFANRSQVDSVYTDFSKAFDRVNHRLLIVKLHKLGFREGTIKWLSSFLVDRKQQVRIYNYISAPFCVSSGVPQGTHCGPILFLLFINDLTCCFHFSNYLLYADDLKLFKTIRSIQDAKQLQLDLVALFNWCQNNCLHLNIKKCYVISFYKTKSHISFDYQLDNVSVSRVLEIKDLGVIFDTTLTFKSHYNHIYNKAMSMWGFIWRHCKDLSPLALKSLYCSLVRSHFDYCSSVWFPFYKIDYERLERVQNKFLRTVEFKMGHSHIKGDYRWIMDKCQIHSLIIRWKISDACVLHDIINGHIDNPSLLNRLSFLIPAVDSRTTRSRNIFRISTSTTLLAQNHPLRRMMEEANEYSCRIRISIFDSSRLKFKNDVSVYYYYNM